MNHATELQIRLRKAKEALNYATEKESEARRSLAVAEASRRAAKDKFDALFLKEEQTESVLRKATYNHCTL